MEITFSLAVTLISLTNKRTAIQRDDPGEGGALRPCRWRKAFTLSVTLITLTNKRTAIQRDDAGEGGALRTCRRRKRWRRKS